MDRSQLGTLIWATTRGEREFRAFWPSFLGVLFMDPRSSGLVFGRFVLGAPNPRSWILKWSAAARPTVVACIGHESRVVAGWIF